MQSLLERLNEQQCRAVTAPVPEPVLVLAGAGCGKTTVLVRRIAWLQHQGYSPRRILALTFTRKAADEMGERVRTLVQGESQSAGPLVTTFHGLGHRIVHQSSGGVPNYVHLGYHSAPKLLDEGSRLELLASITSMRQRRALGLDLMRIDALLEKMGVCPETATLLSAGQRAFLEQVRQQLRRRCRRESCWSFADMLRGVLELFENRDDIARQYAARFDAILVDEFQDTNPIQIRLLNRLLLPRTHLFAVGDDDQAIYGFRGADTGPILNFAAHFPAASIVKLEINYRSTSSILHVANRIFRDKPPAYRKTLRVGGQSPTGPRPQARRFGSEQSMLEWTLHRCRALRDEGVEGDDMVMLFRLNASMRGVRTYFEHDHPGVPTPALMTIHGSKGLEFRVVFLCDLEEGFLPNYRLGRLKPTRKSLKAWVWSLVWRPRYPTPPGCDIGEEQRLFYVGVTRARERLYALSCGRRQIRGLTRIVQPSRFVRLLK